MLVDGQNKEPLADSHKFRSIRILLVDDHPFVRQGIRVTLEQEAGFVVVGEVGDGREVLGAVKRLKPNIVVLDHVLPGAYGLEVAETMRQQLPNTHIIMMSMYEDEAYVGRAVSIGVRGYIAKRAASAELVQAIHAVMDGEIFLSEPHTIASIEKYLASSASATFDVYKTLTEREQEIADLIVDGYSSRRIAEQLCISERTVETHRSHIKRKLGAQTSAEMVRIILEYRQRHSEP